MGGCTRRTPPPRGPELSPDSRGPWAVHGSPGRKCPVLEPTVGGGERHEMGTLLWEAERRWQLGTGVHHNLACGRRCGPGTTCNMEAGEAQGFAHEPQGLLMFGSQKSVYFCTVLSARVCCPLAWPGPRPCQHRWPAVWTWHSQTRSLAPSKGPRPGQIRYSGCQGGGADGAAPARWER